MKKLLLTSLSLSIMIAAPNLYSADKVLKMTLPPLAQMDKLFFGHNPQFVNIMQSSNATALTTIEKEKAAALDAYQKEHSYTGLEVKLAAATELNRHENGYDTGLSWQILDDGYNSYQKKAKRDTIKQAIELNKVLQETKTNFMKVAISEIDSIENSIIYLYAYKKVSFLKQHIAQEKRKLSAGTLSLQSYEELENIFQKSKNTTTYFKTFKPRNFDLSYQSIICNIEHQHLNNITALTQYAIEHDQTLKSQKLQIKKESSYNTDWEDRIQADIYIDQKKYTFLDRKDTKAGFHLNIPLDNPNNKNSLSKIKIASYKQKVKSHEQLLSKKIAYLYSTVDYHKNKIASLKNEIAYYQRQLRYLDLKSKYPIPSNNFNLGKESVLKYVQLIELHQHIWEERCAIIKNYITLQYLTGAKIL